MSKGIQNRYTTSANKSISTAKVGEIIVCNDPSNPKLSFLDANKKQINIESTDKFLPLDGGAMSGDLELVGSSLDVLNGNINLLQESYINVEGTSSIDLTSGATITLDETSDITIKLDSNSAFKPINKKIVTTSGTSEQIICGDGTLKNISEIGTGGKDYLPLSGGTVTGFANFNSGFNSYGAINFYLSETKDNGVSFDSYGIHPIKDGFYNLGTTDLKFDKAYIKTVNATVGFFQTSDERLKDEIKPIETNLDDLSKLRRVSFIFKNDKSKQRQIGFIAQEIKKLYPELVSETENGYLTIDYSKLSVIALDAIDKLFEMNKNLDERLTKIEKLLEK